MQFAIQGITFRTDVAGADGAVCAMREDGTSCWFDVADYSYRGDAFEAARGFLFDVAAEERAEEIERELFPPITAEAALDRLAGPAKCWCGEPRVEWSPEAECQRHYYLHHVAFGGR